jgi:hypothetical protein
MSIKMFIQGQSARSDQELFGLIGHWLVSKKIRERIGMDITADADDIWLISLAHKGAAKGFLSARPLKSGLHIRMFYSDDDSNSLLIKTLINRAVGIAQEHGYPIAWTNERKDSTILPELGFVALPRERGDFCRWEKQLEKHHD